ncbi:uncharacterized protein LOC133909650 [Phragmites australis]|uniref:uncharacterized protein LOC133909650 n=1 Tax=Phragmites australis TaxID=29695 RepID=UPI002D7824CE|nr:uncharacterized protein LOC133909650 [Phragmites australis]
MRLNEHKGKSMWDKAAAVAGATHHGNDGKNASESGKKRTRLWEAAGRVRGEEQVAEAAREEALKCADQSFLSLTISPKAATNLTTEEALARQAKLIARRRSLGMSLAVGAMAWSVDAPCLPLLAGLFAVVSVSMRSVSQSCAALRKGGPAADAVALLSLNWVLLGVLTSPMLPGVARAVVPRVLGPVLTWPLLWC